MYRRKMPRVTKRRVRRVSRGILGACTQTEGAHAKASRRRHRPCRPGGAAE